MFAKDYRFIARSALQGQWALSIGVTLLASLLGGSIGGGSPSATFSSTGNTASQNPFFSVYLPPALIALFVMLASVFAIYGIITLIFGGAVTLGLCQYNIDLVGRRTPPSLNTLFSRFSVLGKAFLLQLAIGFFTFAWALLFIIPGIVASYRYSMAPFLMAQNPNLGVMEAINLSKQMMAGHKGRLFCLDFSFIGWMFLATFTFGIGYL